MRQNCWRCLRPVSECYCAWQKPFASDPKFIILIHPKEYRKAINTGKILRNSLSNADLFVGVDFTDHERLNRLLSDPERRSFLLFPGQQAVQIEDVKTGSEPTKKIQFVILDATWSMAKKMLSLSRNLHEIPRLDLRPEEPSQYKIRKQPALECLSSLECAYRLIEEFGDPQDRRHDQLLEIFDRMVSRQIHYEESARIKS